MSEKILHQKKIRSTAFRQQVLDVFLKYPQAISIERIEQEIGDHDRITLYRTLKTFEESGIIHEIAVSGEEKRLALCPEDCHSEEPVHQHEHIHFQCKKCQEVFCVDVHSLPKITLPGFLIDTLDITAKGLCGNCY